MSVTDLRDSLVRSPDDFGVIRPATIRTVNTDGTVDVDLGDGRMVAAARVLSSYTPGSGRVVEVMARDTSSWLVLGEARTSNPTTVDAQVSMSFPFNVTPAAPSGAANPLVTSAVDVQSWRNNEGWNGAAESNRVAQGAHSTAWGYYRGLYFYGANTFASLDGRTCTSLSIRIARLGRGGNGAAEPVWLAPHTHATQPSGAPYFAAPAINVGSLAWNLSATFTLPAAWGQGLIDGRYAGIGHLYLGTADYALFHGLDTNPQSGQLSMGWS